MLACAGVHALITTLMHVGTMSEAALVDALRYILKQTKPDGIDAKFLESVTLVHGLMEGLQEGTKSIQKPPRKAKALTDEEQCMAPSGKGKELCTRCRSRRRNGKHTCPTHSHLEENYAMDIAADPTLFDLGLESDGDASDSQHGGKRGRSPNTERDLAEATADTTTKEPPVVLAGFTRSTERGQ